MINATSINTNYLNNFTQSQKTKDRSILGKDDFLKLLLIQLRHQDPLEGMDPTEQIAQMAQFSSLEALENMKDTLGSILSSFNISKGANLVGKQVKIEKGNTEITGKVDKVILEDNNVFVVVNSVKYDSKNIKEIF